MPQTTGNKLSLGLSYIAKLSVTHECKSFSGGVTNCKCICNCGDFLCQVQEFFCKEIQQFWSVPDHVAVRKEAEDIGKFFGMYLYPHSSFESERDCYIFNVQEEEKKFYLPTLCKIFGLGQKAHTAARSILTDKKAIGHTLLKKVCWLDLKKDAAHKTLYRNYRSWFKHAVVPVSKK